MLLAHCKSMHTNASPAVYVGSPCVSNVYVHSSPLLLFQMEQLMDRAKLSTRMTYRAVGSSTGQKEFIGNGTFYPDNVFGSGDIPIPTAKFGELQAANVDIVHLPVVLGAISLFHSVPNVPQGEGGLNLTGCLIARIFKREIKDWLHPDIQAINENLRTLSGTSSVPITVAHRRLGSSSTSSVTKVSTMVIHES